MGYDKEKIRQIRGIILFTAAVVLLIMYSGDVLGGIGLLIDIMMPFLAGGAIAFVLNIPMRAIEEKLLKHWRGKAARVLKRPVSLILAIIFIAAILTFVIMTAVPKLQETVGLLAVQIPVFAKRLMQWLEEIASSNPVLLEKLNELEAVKIDWNSLFDKVSGFLTTGMGSVLNSAMTVAGSIIGGTVNTFIAVVFAIYILSQKEKLGNQGHRILSAYLSEKAGAKVEKVLALLYKNFSSFISGQCMEAVILGSMFVIVMTILGFPYALLIGVLIAFLALIPIVGAFVGCFLGAFLILMNDPMQAFWFVILFLILQQIEGNLIYPHVVGNSVGLPSLWVLAAVSVGGSLFGVVGMLCFIPLVSTGYALLRESVNARNAAKSRISGEGAENTDGTAFADARQERDAEESTASTQNNQGRKPGTGNPRNACSSRGKAAKRK